MPTLLFGICIGSAATLIFTWWLDRIPEGYEDETGYHDGAQSGADEKKAQKRKERLSISNNRCENTK